MDDESIELVCRILTKLQEGHNIQGAFKAGKGKQCKDIFCVLFYTEKECGDKNTEQHSG